MSLRILIPAVVVLSLSETESPDWETLGWFPIPGSREVLWECVNKPHSHAAGCEHVRMERVRDVVECVGVLSLTEAGDTINFQDEICQVQRCQHQPSDGSSQSLQRSKVLFTTLYGPMRAWSVLCEPIKAVPLRGQYPRSVVDIGKQEDYWTTSAKMKHDMRSFFHEQGSANWTALELGSYRGYTTRALSDVFALVIAADASKTFLGFNRAHNSDRHNIVFEYLHSRIDGLHRLSENDIQVVMIDAEHDFDSVNRDTILVLRTFRKSLKFLIFDDYGTDEGVRKVVSAFVETGQLVIVGGVGIPPPWHYHDKLVSNWEGVICQVVQQSAVGKQDNDAPMHHQSYSWLVDSWEAEDAIIFRDDGSCVTSRGPGIWRRDQQHDHAVWLEWPSHKPIALGGPDIPQKNQSWFLQFDSEWEKFAAARLDDSSQTAAGVSHNMLQAMVRRLYVSISHEFCNSANECALRDPR